MTDAKKPTHSPKHPPRAALRLESGPTPESDPLASPLVAEIEHNKNLTPEQVSDEGLKKLSDEIEHNKNLTPEQVSDEQWQKFANKVNQASGASSADKHDASAGRNGSQGQVKQAKRPPAGFKP